MRPILFRIIAAGCLASALGLSLAGVIGGSASATQVPTVKHPAVDKVTICHRTDDVKNPYVQETISTSAAWNRLQMPPNNVVGVFPTMPWGDIIPPFVAPDPPGDGKVHSLNWTADGQAIWKGGCLVDLTPPDETPPTTTTEHPEVTTTSTTSPPENEPTTTTTTSPPENEPTTTTTTSPPENEPTTTNPPENEPTTTSPPENEPTTIPPEFTTPTTAPPSELPPPVTSPGGGASIEPPTEAVVVDPHDHVVDLGLLSVGERKTLDKEVAASSATTTTTTTTTPPISAPTQPPTPLAGTGVNVVAMVLTALALILAGSAFHMLSRRMARPGNG